MRESEEIWRPVVGYEGFYEVSDCGRNGYHPSACCRGIYNHHKGFIWKYE